MNEKLIGTDFLYPKISTYRMDFRRENPVLLGAKWIMREEFGYLPEHQEFDARLSSFLADIVFNFVAQTGDESNNINKQYGKQALDKGLELLNKVSSEIEWVRQKIAELKEHQHQLTKEDYQIASNHIDKIISNLDKKIFGQKTSNLVYQR